MSKLGTAFSLSPAEGYISAGMDVPFDVTYHPRDVSNDLCSEVQCLNEVFNSVFSFVLFYAAARSKVSISSLRKLFLVTVSAVQFIVSWFIVLADT